MRRVIFMLMVLAAPPTNPGTAPTHPAQPGLAPTEPGTARTEQPAMRQVPAREVGFGQGRNAAEMPRIDQSDQNRVTAQQHGNRVGEMPQITSGDLERMRSGVRLPPTPFGRTSKAFTFQRPNRPGRCNGEPRTFNAMPIVPPMCAGKPECASCYSEAYGRLDRMRGNLEKLRCTYRWNQEYVERAKLFGDNVSSVYGISGLVWQG